LSSLEASTRRAKPGCRPSRPDDHQGHRDEGVGSDEDIVLGIDPGCELMEAAREGKVLADRRHVSDIINISWAPRTSATRISVEGGLPQRQYRVRLT
jgi:hypothetical protein